MTHLCFVHALDSAAPHLELPAGDTLDQAVIHARRCLQSHGRPVAVEIFKDDQLVEALAVGRSTGPGR